MTNPAAEDLADPRKRVFDLVGQGMVSKSPLADIMARREEKRDWYWIWDFNYSVPENELLRSEGFKVLGGGEFADKMEHDRAACLAFTSTYGLEPPPSFPFSDPGEAIRFCKEHPDTAFVYKPDNGANHETFLPESEEGAEANEELRVHLATLDQPSTFILQERKEGVETNVEVWFQEGDPIFAFMQLECNRRMVGDLGELTGCAFD